MKSSSDLPPSSDKDARTGIRRLIDVSMGVIVPAEELEKDPLPNAVALMDLSDAVANGGKVCILKRIMNCVDNVKKRTDILT